MNLKADYHVHKRKILIELETVDFTPKEAKIIEMLGDPRIEFKKTYSGGHTIAISKKIRSEFKIRVRIDGTNDFELANSAGQEFIRDIKEHLEEKMEELADEYELLQFPPIHERLKISDLH